MSDLILSELKEISKLLRLQKQVLTMDDFCTYTGFSKGHAYKLTSTNRIRFYKPLGKAIFFDLEDVVEFLKTNEIKSNGSFHKNVENYFINKSK